MARPSAGQSGQVTAFAAWGLPAWFRALVGTFEVLGGILLIVPATILAGSAILSTIMVGALWAHAANGEWSHLLPVVVLLTLFFTKTIRISWRSRYAAGIVTMLNVRWSTYHEPKLAAPPDATFPWGGC